MLVLPASAFAAPKSNLDNPQAPLSGRQNKVFSDEFDWAPPAAPEGKDERDPLLPITKWRTTHWFGAGNARHGDGQAYYTDTGKSSWQFASVVDYNPFTVKDGVLSITAKRDEVPYLPAFHYVSGLLTTLKSFWIDYGYFEIRAKSPGVSGTQALFSLYPFEDYQIQSQSASSWTLNLMEVLGSSPARLSVTNREAAVDGGKDLFDESFLETGANDDGFHVFGFDKQPGKVNIYRDGVLLLSKKTSPKMTSPGYLCLTLDVGKDGGRAGTPNAADFPQSLQVDYIRVYKTKYTKTVGGPFAGIKLGDILPGSKPD